MIKAMTGGGGESGMTLFHSWNHFDWSYDRRRRRRWDEFIYFLEADLIQVVTEGREGGGMTFFHSWNHFDWSYDRRLRRTWDVFISFLETFLC